MREPLHHFSDAFYPEPLGQLRSLDHDHGQAQLPRGVDLGTRALAAGISRHDPLDMSRTQQFQFAGERERPARDDEIGVRQRQRTSGSVDEAERVGMLRHGREWRDKLPADGEENIGARLGQRGYRGRDVIHLDPAIVSGPDPRLALQRDQWRCRGRAGSDRIAADFGRERMGGIDHMREFFLPDEVGKPICTAEAADSGRQRLIDRNLCSAGVGIDRVEAGGRDFSRQPIGFARSAQDENAHG